MSDKDLPTITCRDCGKVSRFLKNEHTEYYAVAFPPGWWYSWEDGVTHYHCDECRGIETPSPPSEIDLVVQKLQEQVHKLEKRVAALEAQRVSQPISDDQRRVLDCMVPYGGK